MFLDVLEILEKFNRAEHGRAADAFKNFLEDEGENCFIPEWKWFFLKCNNYFVKEDITKEYFEFIQSCKRSTNVMTRCRIPKICDIYKVDTGISDVKRK